MYPASGWVGPAPRAFRRRHGAGPWFLFGVVLVFVLPGNAVSPPSATVVSHGPAATAVPDPVAGYGPAAWGAFNSTLTVSSTSANLSDLFWGTTVSNEVPMFPGETDAVNATPAHVLVWPGGWGGDDYDPFNEQHYSTWTGVPTNADANETQFVQMCKAIHCRAIMELPAEIDDPRIAEQIVNYTEVNLSFTPAYWQLGNEPEFWEHWGVPWADWQYHYTTGPTPDQFGQEVLAYANAIRSVDASTPIMGLPAAGCYCGGYTYEQWIAGVLKYAGSKIQAVAFHEYPAGWNGWGSTSLLAFYQSLQTDVGIPARLEGARQAINDSCPNPCNVSVFVGELGSALAWSPFGPFAAEFSGALSLAAQITQAMDYNATNLDLFATQLSTTNSWFNRSAVARPDYALYTDILDHLGTEAFPVGLPGLDNSLYAIDTIAPDDHGRRDLLVVNDNITSSASFTPLFAENPTRAPVEAWAWNGTVQVTDGVTQVQPNTPEPVAQEFPSGLPSAYTVPPQGLVLFEEYPSGASYVHVIEHGLPASTPWYTSVGPELHRSSGTNLSLLLPTGWYPVSSLPVPLPLGGKEHHPTEQLGSSVDSPTFVRGDSTDIGIAFTPQWRVNVSASPSEGGTVQPDVGWWQANESLTLTATPAPGFAFDRWSGWGPGSYNGTGRSISIAPAGAVREKALFVAGRPVTFQERGLPRDTPWSITVRGFTSNSTYSNLTVYEPNGSYGFTVDPVPGYRSVPRAGAFIVGESPAPIPVRFVRLTPPPPRFAVTFILSGLPAALPVTITVRNDSQAVGGPSGVFYLSNGSYAYEIGYVPGYHPVVSPRTFDVTGDPLTIEIPFDPTVYVATWEANGTRSGLGWSVEVNGTTRVATSAWVSISLPNGSYPFRILAPDNFTVTPRTGFVELAGSGAVFYTEFTLLEFPKAFEATGLDAATAWAVRFGNVTEGTTASRETFEVANGSYTFDVEVPSGYYAAPSHGTIVVAGATPPVQIQFHLSSERPSNALVAALNSGALSVSVWLGASIFVGFVGIRWFRGRDH